MWDFHHGCNTLHTQKAICTGTYNFLLTCRAQFHFHFLKQVILSANTYTCNNIIPERNPHFSLTFSKAVPTEILFTVGCVDDVHNVPLSHEQIFGSWFLYDAVGIHHHDVLSLKRPVILEFTVTVVSCQLLSKFLKVQPREPFRFFKF